MTIVKNTLAISHHPLVHIDPSVAEYIIQGAAQYQMIKKLKSFTIHPQVQLLEAYCDLTGQRITMETLKTPDIESILRNFTAAVAGTELIDIPERQRMSACRRLYQALAAARIKHPDHHSFDWDVELLKPDSTVCARIAEAGEHQRWYWKGWSIHRPNSFSVHLRMAALVSLYGRAFVDNIFVAIEKYYRGRAGYFRSEWNAMFDYLTEHHRQWPVSTFKTEKGIKRFMLTFTRAHFIKAKAAGNDGRSKIKSWGRFLNAVETSLCKPEVWASLTSPIRRPPPATKHGSETKLRKDENGILFQEKLLTTIPLHITDVKAIDVLFYHIKSDIETVRGWAGTQAAELKSRQAWRSSLARQGTTITVYGGRRKAKYYTQEDICATLEDINSQVPQTFLRMVHEHLTGARLDSAQFARHYGFPMKGCLYPFQCLLVLEHPKITKDFLNGFLLYNEANEEGQISGFDEEKRLLIGYKNRKQSDVREQIIELNDISFSLIKDIIELTSVGRRKLKAQGDDTYRQLFINSSKGTTHFGYDHAPLWNDSAFVNSNSLLEQLISQFSPHSDLSERELVEFIKRVELGKIRDSAAVAVFLKTKSSEEMSKALGHEHYYPDLLSHYLPDALLKFVKARWIRIFQKALVCEAMKDSPYLLRVTQFNNMDELHTFLDNHRIREIPAQASDPERKAQREEIETHEAVLSIGVPFLASLLSLEAAVTESSDRARVCGKAEYWASFADKIKKEITGGVNRLLKKHLDAALKLVDAKKMEALIYVPTHWS